MVIQKMYDGIIIINKTRRPCKPEKPDRIEPHTSVRFFLGSQASRSIDSVSRSYGPQSGEERNRKGRERVWQWRKRASPTPSCSSFSPRSSKRSPTLSLSLSSLLFFWSSCPVLSVIWSISVQKDVFSVASAATDISVLGGFKSLPCPIDPKFFLQICLC